MALFRIAFQSSFCISKTVSLTNPKIRALSTFPDNMVYGVSKTNIKAPDEKVTTTHLMQKRKKGEAITLVTAYDYSSAMHVDAAGIDVILVGDSASMVMHGHDNTLPISLDEMLVHCRAVARGAKRPLLVADLPFGTYESSLNQAVDTAIKLMKGGGMDAIKLECVSPLRVAVAKAIVEAGIAVMGHIGLTPHAISALAGFRPQGKNVAGAVKIVDAAMALQEAGCFSVVLECIPAPVAAAVTSAIQVPTIGVGAGPFCNGQGLVYHDIIGIMQHPHQAKVTPTFVKQYGCVGNAINKALLYFKEEVTSGSFPDNAHSPYKISAIDTDYFLIELKKLGLDKAVSAVAEATEKIDKVQLDHPTTALA